MNEEREYESDEPMDSGVFLGELVQLTVERAGQTRRNTKTVISMSSTSDEIPAIELEIIARYVNKKDAPVQDFIILPLDLTPKEAQMIYDNAVDTVRGLQILNIGEIN